MNAIEKYALDKIDTKGREINRLKESIDSVGYAVREKYQARITKMEGEIEVLTEIKNSQESKPKGFTEEDMRMSIEQENEAKKLLGATLTLLEKCDRSDTVLDILETTAFWDDAECDGNCLMEEITDLLDNIK